MSSPAVKIQLHPESGIEFKTCSKCKDLKPLWDFSRRKDRPSGFQSQCQKCIAENQKEYAKNNPNTMRRTWRKKALKAYGLTPVGYQKLLNEQNGVCAICGLPETRVIYKKIVLCVDHDHKTGKVRALLCSRCNILLGQANENVELLQKMASYLKEHAVE